MLHISILCISNGCVKHWHYEGRLISSLTLTTRQIVFLLFCVPYCGMCPHPGRYWFLVNDQHDAQFFTNVTHNSLLCIYFYFYLSTCFEAPGGVAVKTLRYKPAGRGFDSRWCHWSFSLTYLRPQYGPGVDSASNRNEYQVYFLGVKTTGA